MAGTEAIPQKLSAGLDVAWISRGSQVRFAVSPWERADPRRPFHSGLNSAVVRLIEGIYATEPRWSFAWLRNRIFTTEQAGVASAATVQVAARRVAWGVAVGEFLALLDSGCAEEVEPLRDATDPECDPGAVLVPVRAGLRRRGDPDFIVERMNQARTHRTLHAEVQVIREWLKNPEFGVPLELEVTLKCCKMCAAWIFEAFAGRNEFEVIYASEDPGRLARFTALEAGTPQRSFAIRKLGLAPDWEGRPLERKGSPKV